MNCRIIYIHSFCFRGLAIRNVSAGLGKFLIWKSQLIRAFHKKKQRNNGWIHITIFNKLIWITQSLSADSVAIRSVLTRSFTQAVFLLALTVGGIQSQVSLNFSSFFPSGCKIAMKAEPGEDSEWDLVIQHYVLLDPTVLVYVWVTSNWNPLNLLFRVFVLFTSSPLENLVQEV